MSGTNNAVIVNATIQTGDFRAGTKEMSNAIRDFQQSVRNMDKIMRQSLSGYSAAMKENTKSAVDFDAEMRRMTAEAEALKNALDAQGKAKQAFDELTERLKEAVQNAENVKAKLDELNQKYEVKMEESGMKSLMQQVEALDARISRLRGAMSKLGNSETDRAVAATYAKQISTLRQQSDALQSQINNIADNSEIANLEAEIEKVQHAAEAADQAVEKLTQQSEDMAVNVGSEELVNKQKQDYAELQQQIEMMKAAMDDSENAPQEQAEANSQAFAGLRKTVADVRTAILKIGAAAGRTAASIAKMAGGAALTYLRTLASVAGNVAIQLAKLSANAVVGGLKAIGTVASKSATAIAKLSAGGIKAAIGGFTRLAGAVKKAATQIAKIGGTAIKGLASVAGKAAKAVLGINKVSKGDGFKRGFKNIMRYALGIRSLFFLFRRLRTAISDGMKQLAKSNPALKASLDGLSKALSGLKGSLATAFAPILTAVAPALTTLINMLTTAINTIGAFMAALTGQTMFQASVGLKEVDKAAGGAAGSAKELERQLAGFDELEVLKGNSGGGGGGGGGSGSGLQYETQQIENGLVDFVEKIKALFSAQQFEAIGHLIADGINGAIEKAKNLISWDALGGKITEFVTAFTGIFNGLVDGIDWENIGATLGTGINTLVKTVNLLFDNIRFYNIGQGLGEALNGLITEVNWDELGVMLSQKTNALLAVILGALTEFDFSAAGNAFGTLLYNMIDSINFGVLGTDIVLGVHGLIDFINSAIGDYDWAGLASEMTAQLNLTIQRIHWYELGSTMASMFNTALESFATFVGEFDFSQAGTALGTSISAFVGNIDWATVGTALSNGFIGAMDYLTSALYAIEWDFILDSMAEGIAAIDWTGSGDAFAQLMNKLFAGDTTKGAEIAKQAIDGILSGLGTAVSRFDWGDAGTSFRNTIATLYSKDTFDRLGRILATGINGAIGAMTEVVTGFEWGDIGTDFADTVSNLMNTLDWLQVGVLLGAGMHNAIAFVKNVVLGFEWDDAGTHFTETVKGIADAGLFTELGETLAGLIEGAIDALGAAVKDFPFAQIAFDFAGGVNKIFGINWEHVGETLAKWFNGAIGMIGTAISEVPWNTYMVKFMVGVNKFFYGIEWDALGHTLAGLFAIPLNFIYTAVTEFDWHHVLEGFSTGLNSFVTDLRVKIGEQDWKAAGLKVTDGLLTLRRTVDWNGIADLLTTSFNGVLDFIGTTLDGLKKDAPGLALQLAQALNKVITGVKWSGGPTSIGGIFSSLLNYALDFMRVFILNFDEVKFANNIKAALAEVKWGEIAKKAWDLMKDAFMKLGNFITVLFGGEVDKKSINEVTAQIKSALGKGNAARNETELDKLAGGEDQTMGGVLSQTATTILDAIKKAFASIPWAEWGDRIHQFLVDIDWESVASKLWSAIIEAAKGLGSMLLHALFGQGFENPIKPEESDKEREKNTTNYAHQAAAIALQDLEGVEFETRFEEVGAIISSSLYQGAEGPMRQAIAEAIYESFNGIDYQFLVREGVDITALLASGIRHGKYQLEDAGDEVIVSFSDGTKLALRKADTDIVALFEGLGYDITDGTVHGIGTNMDAKARELAEIFGIPYEEAADELEVHSPSKLFERLGGMVVQGLINGLETLKKALKGVWDGLPDWAKDMINNVISQFTGYEIDLGVIFEPSTPAGNTYKNGGLLKYLQNIFAPGVDTNARVGLQKSGWSTIGGFIGILSTLFANVGLKKDGWSSAGGFIGILSTLFAKIGLQKSGWTTAGGFIGILSTLFANIGLSKSGWSSIGGFIGILSTLFAALGLSKSGWSTLGNFIGTNKTQNAGVELNRTDTWKDGFLKWLTGAKDGKVKVEVDGSISQKLKNLIADLKNTRVGGATTKAEGGSYYNGRWHSFASGGAISANGRPTWWNSVHKYAAGTRSAHGTLFVAGEAGPEVVGHVGGRTEVLNRSQLAATMKVSVTAGMVEAMRGITFKMPAMAMGVMPYEVSAQIAKTGAEIQNTMNANNEDLIQTIISVIGAQTTAIVAALQSIERNGGNASSINAQDVINEINRRTQMFGTSPLAGV